MSYADLSKKDYIHTDTPWVKATNRHGVFQNWETKEWEYWAEGTKVASIPFAHIPTEGALSNWLESIE